MSVVYHLFKPYTMTPFELHPRFYNQPIRLSKEEQAEPLEILQDFFQTTPFPDIRRLLWQLVETSLCVPHSVWDDASDRQTLLWFYRELERSLEAARLLACAANTKK
jgi:hypothetical protein